MFRIILISFITLLHLYVFWRINTIPFVKRTFPKKIILSIGLLLWLLFLAGRIHGHNGTGTVAMMLEFTGMNWMATIFLVFICIFAVDVLTIFGLLLPKLTPSIRGGAVVIGITLSIVALIQGLREPVIQKYEVEIPGLSSTMNGIVVIAMSDLHIGSILGKEWLEDRVNQVQEEKPDLIVIVGDTFEGHGEPGKALLPVFKKLSAPLGVFAVNGNHENYGHTDNTVLLKDAGIKILRNQWTEISQGLVLAGVDDLTAIRRSGNDTNEVINTVKDIPPSTTTILLSHTPWQYEKAAQAGVDLMLSGHTHGGQVWPFGYLVKKQYPIFAGKYEVDDMSVIVCRGTGTWGPRMRLWRPSEILRITLKTKA